MRRPAAGVGGVLSVKPGGRGAAAEKRSGAARVGERRKPAVEWAVGYLLAG